MDDRQSPGRSVVRRPSRRQGRRGRARRRNGDHRLVGDSGALPRRRAARRRRLAHGPRGSGPRRLGRRRAARPAARPDLRQAAVPLILAGLAFAVDVGSFHLAINGTRVANATFIGNVAPILTVIGGAISFQEHPPWRVWIALALALAGAWVMAGMVAPSRIGSGDALALAAATAYARYLLIIKLLRASLDGPTATLWSAAVSAIALTVAALLHGETMIPSSLAGWATVFLLGLVSTRWGGADIGRGRPSAGRSRRAGHPRSAAVLRPVRLGRAGRGDDGAADGRRRRSSLQQVLLSRRLRRLPRSAFGGTKQRVDDAHVQHRVLDRILERRRAEHGARKASPCNPYWSQTGNSSTLAPPPNRSAPLSIRIFVGRSGGALKGIFNLDPPISPTIVTR